MHKIAFVFPGQGSQSLSMLSDIATQFPEVEQTFAEASAVCGYDLWELVQHGPEEVLNQTQKTQPAVLTASYAIWRIIQAHKKIQPAYLAGHSLGEYTALVCAQALSFTDAVRLVDARGRFMQEAVPGDEGGLVAIVGLDDDSVRALCEKAAVAGEVLSPANFNSPGQVVVAGHKKAIERLMGLAKEAGARLTLLLPVSVPAHCSLMKPAAIRLQALLAEIPFQKPLIPVINNVDVLTYISVEGIRDGLTRQMTMPVRWVEIIQTFAQAGMEQIVECGPGKILSGLNKRIASGLQLTNTADLDNLTHFLRS